ncbi:GPW/gp25 family protein [Desulfobacter vibrioformis]|nr:GPW/gp25 family protein [Desulfobacter vibrioformis]
MHPEFGYGIQAMVFDTMDTATVTTILDLVRRAVFYFELRWCQKI